MGAKTGEGNPLGRLGPNDSPTVDTFNVNDPRSQAWFLTHGVKSSGFYKWNGPSIWGCQRNRCCGKFTPTPCQNTSMFMSTVLDKYHRISSHSFSCFRTLYCKQRTPPQQTTNSARAVERTASGGHSLTRYTYPARSRGSLQLTRFVLLTRR